MQNDPDHFRPSVRLIELEKQPMSSFGFELTRSKWDPYPWISTIEPQSAAAAAALQPGDCLLEIDGEDIVGMKICKVAELVKSKTSQVSLLLWNAGADAKCSPEAICCGPMPKNLQRLSACMSAILSFLECPVCLDTIQPPTYQCENGHLICIHCKTKSGQCPVCRLCYNQTRSLLCDQIYNALISAFELKDEPEDKRSARMRQIFMAKKKHVPKILVSQTSDYSSNKGMLGRFLTKSVDNLSQMQSNQLQSRSHSSHELTGSQRLAPGSWQGSFESLRVSPSNNKYHCPFSTHCAHLLDGDKIIEHFRHVHSSESLIQFFQQSITVKLTKLIKNKSLCFVVHLDHVFFLRMERNKSKIDESKQELLVWIWILGDRQLAKEYSMRLQVVNAKNVSMSIWNNICALNSVSYQELQGFKRGIYFNSDMLDYMFSSPKNVTFEVHIARNDV